MRDFIDILLGYVLENKKRAVAAGLFVLQVILLLPLILGVMYEKADYEEMEKEALNARCGEIVSEEIGAFAKRPFDYYWRENQKDLFLRSKRFESAAAMPVEPERTVPLNFVGVFRTEHEATAMIKDTRNGGSFFLKEGDKASGFKIVRIHRDTLVVRAPSGELVQLTQGQREEVAY